MSLKKGDIFYLKVLVDILNNNEKISAKTDNIEYYLSYFVEIFKEHPIQGHKENWRETERDRESNKEEKYLNEKRQDFKLYLKNNKKYKLHIHFN